MFSPQRALRHDLEARSFRRVYYVHGADDFLKDEAVRELTERAVDAAMRAFNLESVRGGEAEPRALDTLLATPPMLAERRVVVIRDVAALRRTARSALDRYLSQPAADTVVVLVAVAGSKPDRALEAAVLAAAGLVVEFPLLTGDRVARWIVHHASTRLQAKITPAAAELLHAAVGSDLPQLAAELDKLASYVGGRGIDDDAVAAVVGVRRGETLGDLLDRVAARDAAGALALLPVVLLQPKTGGVPVVMALTTQTLALAWARARRDRGSSAAALERELFALLKETGSHPFRPWTDAVRSWLGAVDRWNEAELARATRALLDADCALKNTRVSSDEQVLTTLILSLCAPVRAAA